MLLRAAGELVPDGMALETFDLDAIPLYNGDVEAQGLPEPVQDLLARIANTDALLIVTPEYNYSIPGVLKNALDWASRAPSPPLVDKPCAILGASPGLMGTVRAQMHLRQVALGTNMLCMNRPEVFVASAAKKFDEAGKLIDDPTRAKVAELLAALGAWTRRLGLRPE